MAKQTVKPASPDDVPPTTIGAEPDVAMDGVPRTPTTGPLQRNEIKAVAGILLAGLLVRLILMPATGHETDLGTFESWTLSLVKYGIRNFYAHAGFVDYPPGYMFILAAFGAVYHALAGFHWPFDLLRFTVKSPAVLSDLGLAYLSFLIVRRTWSANAGLFALAIVAFNPAVWFVSAYWGQADSVTAVFVMWSVYMALRERFELSWLLFGFAVLIKPQPAVLAPLLLIWQLRRHAAPWRLALIPVIGFVVAYAGSVFFAPDANAVHVVSWLYDRYHTGTVLYPYNSCNAFNLYSTRLDFWQPDSKLIPNLPGFPGWPQWEWGVTIVAAFVLAVGLRLWRTTTPDHTRAEQESSLYMALFIALLGLFMFATRMHERYLFSALAIGPLIWNTGRLSRVVYIALCVTFLLNLEYALRYLYAPSPDLAPALVHPASLLNVLCLFLIAGAYLVPEMGESLESALAGLRAKLKEDAVVRSRPLLAGEGLIGLTRVDAGIITALMAIAAGLLYYKIGQPRERIFDEIYYARSAQEYLHHQPQFEWTHPPLSKLILTIGAWIYKVDPVGARLMSALFGTLTVPLLYAFAKRLFSSSAAAAVSVFLLLTSSYFYVQARIATPEIFVAFFALLTIYCMYRFWIAAQIVKASERVVYPDGTQVSGASVLFPFGERVPLKSAKLIDGDQTVKWSQAHVDVQGEETALRWNSDASIEGSVDARPVRDRQAWTFWLIMTAVAAGCVIASKWNGLFDLAGIWVVALAVSLQRRLPWVSPVAPTDLAQPPKRFVWGNAYGFRIPLFAAACAVCVVGIYLLTYIPFFQTGNSILGLHHSLSDLLALQSQMYHYHHDLKATHPYSSAWWTWPFELRPVSYYYHVFSGTAAPNQIVAEVIALPNPAVWLAGLLTVPVAAVLAWRQRHKGMMLCIAAYFFQWLPWVASTRIDFQYNFYPDCAIICLCSAYVLATVWRSADGLKSPLFAKSAVVAYLAVCLVLFVFFLPILNGTHLTWTQWDARIWLKDGVPHPYGWI